jgi:hypothetical protein
VTLAEKNAEQKGQGTACNTRDSYIYSFSNNISIISKLRSKNERKKNEREREKEIYYVINTRLDLDVISSTSKKTNLLEINIYHPFRLSSLLLKHAIN